MLKEKMMNDKMPEFQKDFEDFIALCNKHELEYLVIGGLQSVYMVIREQQRTWTYVSIRLKKTQKKFWQF